MPPTTSLNPFVRAFGFSCSGFSLRSICEKQSVLIFAHGTTFLRST